MAKTVVITQSNYMPWRGHFDMIRQADELILFDIVQYTRRDWRNRNLIKTPRGTHWLTIPVETKGRYLQSIDETRISGRGWADQHIRAIELNYRRAAAFDAYGPWLFDAIRSAGGEEFLSRCNQHLLGAICGRLSIRTPIRTSTDFLQRAELAELGPSERLLRLCLASGATRYLSGPAAREYMDCSLFARHDIEIAWMNYDGYPEYQQCWGAFEPRVSVIDLLLNCGDRAPQFLVR